MDAPQERAWMLDSLGATLRETVRIFGRHPLLILAIGCLPWIAVDAVAALLGVSVLGWEELNQGFSASLKRPLLQWALYFVVTTLVVFPLVEGALTQAMGKAYLRSSVSFGRVFRSAGRRWRALVGVHLWVLVRCAGVSTATGAGAYLLVHFLLPEDWQAGKISVSLVGVLVVAYVYWLRWSLAVPVVVLEGVGPGAALVRSRELTQGYRGQIFVVVGVGTGLSWILSAGMQRLGIGAETGVSLGNGLEFIALPLVYLGRRVRQGGYTSAELAEALERGS